MFELFKRAGEDAELRALLDEYGVAGAAAGEGAYGRVYFGHYEGRPVAIKVEERALRYRLDADVGGIADAEHAVLVGDGGSEKLLDAGLVRRAFAEWWGRRGRGAASFFGGDRAGLEAFRAGLENGVVGVLGLLGDSLAGGGAASVGDISGFVAGRVRSGLGGRARAAFRGLEGALPEFVFAVVRAGWLPKFHPSRAGDDVVGPYETLSRSKELLEADSDRRSLRETLDWMRAGGVLSGDIHEENIMERPGTGEWVLIDYGLYRFVTEE